MWKGHPLVQVAMAVLANPTSRHWGYELSRQTGVRSGVLYPMLTRMLDGARLKTGGKIRPPSATSARPGGTTS